MLRCPFFARVKVNHSRVYSCISANVSAVAMATELLKNKALGRSRENVPLDRFFLNFYCSQIMGCLCQKCTKNGGHCLVSRQGELWSFFPCALDLSVSVGFYTATFSTDFKQYLSG